MAKGKDVRIDSKGSKAADEYEAETNLPRKITGKR